MKYIIKTDNHNNVVNKEYTTLWYSTDIKKSWSKSVIKVSIPTRWYNGDELIKEYDVIGELSYDYIETGCTRCEIGTGVTSIGDAAFQGCRSLTEIEIPNSVTTIGDSAFRSCESLRSIIIPDSVTSIGDGAFKNCTSLSSITIPDSVTEIGYDAFYGCERLGSITIPDSVTSIGDSAFGGCTSLTSVIIGTGVTFISREAFGYCTHLTEIEISNSVTSIGDRAFSHCSGLSNITIPDSVTTIGDSAFYNCTSLSNVTIGAGVTNIGYNAFQYCSIENLIIPENVEGIQIRCYAFSDCQIKNLTIQGHVIIDDYAFSNCNGIETVTIGDNCMLSYDSFYNSDSVKKVLFLDGAESIKPGIVNNINNVKTVYLPDSVKYIDEQAFLDCSTIGNINLDKVETISRFAFTNCTNITELNMPNIKYIGEGAFNGCNGLGTIELGSGLERLGGLPFEGCNKLYKVIYDGISYKNKNELITALRDNGVYVADTIFNDTSLT